jgi:hypothetical protein
MTTKVAVKIKRLRMALKTVIPISKAEYMVVIERVG